MPAIRPPRPDRHPDLADPVSSIGRAMPRRTSARMAGRDHQGCGQPGGARCGHHRAGRVNPGLTRPRLPRAWAAAYNPTGPVSASILPQATAPVQDRAAPDPGGTAGDGQIGPRVCQRCASQQRRASAAGRSGDAVGAEPGTGLELTDGAKNSTLWRRSSSRGSRRTVSSGFVAPACQAMNEAATLC